MDKFTKRELAAMLTGNQMVRHHFIRNDDRPARDAFCQKYHNRDIFESVSLYSDDNCNSECLTPLVFDLDGPDLNAGKDDALRIIDRLGEKDLRPEMVNLSFSGCKGIHAEVPPVVFGYLHHPKLCLVWKTLAAKFFREGIKSIDRGIYQPNRLLRMVNTINTKSNLHKIAIEFKELRDYDLEYIRELAKRPREYESMAVPEECPKAIAWLRDEALP